LPYEGCMQKYQDLINIFHECFFKSYNTELTLGGDEPLYLPADPSYPHHRIIFARGYFSSALHECAHWLIAGENRRKLLDFGYWYVPDGRSEPEQSLFQQVEIKPQAMEWILSEAAGAPFFVSIDNLFGNSSDSAVFKQAVYEQVKIYAEKGLPERARIFREAIAQFYGRSKELYLDDFHLEALK